MASSYVWDVAEPDAIADPYRRKLTQARQMLALDPDLWLGTGRDNTRALGLINASSVDFITYDLSCYLAKIVYQRKLSTPIFHLSWTGENDRNCMQWLCDTGAAFRGFFSSNDLSVALYSLTIHIKISIPEASRPKYRPISKGYFRALASKTYVYRGPPESCMACPWDCMIIYDALAGRDFINTPEIYSRKWDILLMRMCDDFDYPWLVAAMRDSGSAAGLEKEFQVPNESEGIEQFYL